MNRATSSTPGPHGSVLRAVLTTLAERGVAPDAVLAAAGIDKRELDLPLTVARSADFWPAVTQVSGDATLGLRVAEMMTFEKLDLLGYMLRASSDGLEAARRLERYVPMWMVGLSVRVKIEPDRVTFEQRWPKGHDVPRACDEFVLATAFVLAGQLVGTQVRPSAVWFTHRRPRSSYEHRRLFGIQPEFGMPVTLMMFEELAEMRTLSGADSALGRILEAAANQALTALPASDDFVERVRFEIRQALAGSNAASTAQVAHRMQLNARTLRRRLDERGTRFQLVLDEVRKEISLGELTKRGANMAELAWRLGFSEVSAFHRAFKRWMGITPGEFIARHKPPADRGGRALVSRLP